MIPMVGDGDMTTPRGMGHFVLAIDPERFGGREVFLGAMRAYLAALRTEPTRPGETVMAPGDREWRVEAERARDGIPLDPDTAAFLGFGGRGEKEQGR
ncbi:Ldh family oxidoreductase, partial [uncultured Amaricoccus sp.]|uniref:Ldh family oxidoreductase n=1 Tax=uncultured Amaricoccus sp. TaxID=339341 RepID=UPI00260856C0